MIIEISISIWNPLPLHTRWCILDFPTVSKSCVLHVFGNDYLMLINEQGSIHTKMPMTKLASIKILTNFTLSCRNVWGTKNDKYYHDINR